MLVAKYKESWTPSAVPALLCSPPYFSSAFPVMYATKWTELLGRVALVAALFGTSVSNAYTWPNPLLEELDHQLHDRKGYNAARVPIGLSPDCTAFVAGPLAGRSDVADWVRTVSGPLVFSM